MDRPTITEQVQAKYAAAAVSNLSNDHRGVAAVAEAFGYRPEDLASIPAEANLGLSCGNPLILAHLREGETVVDLGCGGGIDVLLAAQKVGATGKAIGIDMTPEMLERAVRNAVQVGKGTMPGNVEFRRGHIEEIPLPDASVDCLISNCVINLSLDKNRVFREMYRVLKPGGRVAVSDIALKQPLPPALGQDIMAYVGCIAGAILIDAYERGLRAAGFQTVQIVDSGKDLNVYTQILNDEGARQAGCCSPTMESNTLPITSMECCGSSGTAEGVHEGLAELLRRYNVNDYAASVQVYAVKG